MRNAGSILLWGRGRQRGRSVIRPQKGGGLNGRHEKGRNVLGRADEEDSRRQDAGSGEVRSQPRRDSASPPATAEPRMEIRGSPSCLALEIEDILFVRRERPSRKPLVRYKSFRYQAESWSRARRVVVKVEHQQGELFPRVGFVVTSASLPSRSWCGSTTSAARPSSGSKKVNRPRTGRGCRVVASRCAAGPEHQTQREDHQSR